MTRIILTAEEMRAAEAAAIASGTTVETLMERAGTAAADAIWSYAGPLPALVLCGPGNNGGDGYVIARVLRERGMHVRVAATAEPRSEAARAARARWTGPVEPIGEAAGAPLVVDALFGTGLARPIDGTIVERLLTLSAGAEIRVAIDLPSGVATDDGSVLSPVPVCDLTITFQTLKPSHRLQPAARHMGRIVIADIGVTAASRLHEIAAPRLRTPGPDDHKYSRGYVALLGGEMPGATALAACAAARTGAGYVRLFASEVVHGVPSAVVQTPGVPFAHDERIGALAIGPGLGTGPAGQMALETALASAVPLVIDADGLNLLAQAGLPNLPGTPILTPHAGEFARLFGEQGGSKVDRARAASDRSGAVILFKGADTVVAAPDGRAAIAPPMPHWLASAGTGDVLTGIVAAMRASGLGAFEAACAGVWLQGRAATLAGPALIADDLIAELPAAVADCL
ncbi:NAD(P)H-hydrate dehydratase [Sphingosinicella sp. CPCC 101087]|uniref:NAD(P)H-hydrate dehydratase n=1 Tax=Sphingosinicella sp. CPCC 101087 TaxID=2497754 RepID=UPI001FB0EA76|nr:NAD(P)H-hydrate dehydratase [Sphingosinicella sp. CPCC 101087]